MARVAFGRGGKMTELAPPFLRVPLRRAPRKDAVLELMGHVDSFIPTPKRETEKAMFDAVEDEKKEPGMLEKWQGWFRNGTDVDFELT